MKQIAYRRPAKGHSIEIPRWIGAPLFWGAGQFKKPYLYGLIALAALIKAYTPYMGFLGEKGLHAELCEKAGDIRAVSTFLATTDPYNQMDLATIDQITLVGDRRVQNRPVMGLPIIYNEIQIPLREHPAIVRVMQRDKAQEMLGHTIADDLEARYCDPKAPWTPHTALIELFETEEDPTFFAPNPERETLEVADNSG